jgi:hypothetical protein
VAVEDHDPLTSRRPPADTPTRHHVSAQRPRAQPRAHCLIRRHQPSLPIAGTGPRLGECWSMTIVWRERFAATSIPVSQPACRIRSHLHPLSRRASPSRHGLSRLGRAPVPARCRNGTQAVWALPRRSCSQKLAGPILSLRDYLPLPDGRSGRPRRSSPLLTTARPAEIWPTGLCAAPARCTLWRPHEQCPGRAS